MLPPDRGESPGPGLESTEECEEYGDGGKAADGRPGPESCGE